jgi:hypothetical protein
MDRFLKLGRLIVNGDKNELFVTNKQCFFYIC